MIGLLNCDYRSLPSIGRKADLILIDPPFGTTSNKWDTPPSYPELWSACREFSHDKTAVLCFTMAPESARLLISNEKSFRYELIWEKTRSSGFLNSKKQPLRSHEKIFAFYNSQPKYNPQFSHGHAPTNSILRRKPSNAGCYGSHAGTSSAGGSTKRYPRSVLRFSHDTQKTSIHPTQKPVDLLRYLIRTYTDPGDLVLDLFAGSGSTAAACIDENRDFYGCEIDRGYFEKAKDRLSRPTQVSMAI